MQVLVCGGRNYANRRHLYYVLDELKAFFGTFIVITGGAPGADALAGDWARERSVEVDVHPADWQQYGRAAGPIRNAYMCSLLQAGDIAVAFPGGRGTSDMVRRLRSSGFPVIEEKI